MLTVLHTKVHNARLHVFIIQLYVCSCTGVPGTSSQVVLGGSVGPSHVEVHAVQKTQYDRVGGRRRGYDVTVTFETHAMPMSGIEVSRAFMVYLSGSLSTYAMMMLCFTFHLHEHTCNVSE